VNYLKITRAYLDKKVKHYMKAGEKDIAKAFILKYGPELGLNIGEELQKLDKSIKRIKQPQNEIKEKIKESE
jgi:cell division protein ZapA (FtsZ GTPase activity inhibitor)